MKISEKRDNFVRYAQSFNSSFLEISVAFDFGVNIISHTSSYQSKFGPTLGDIRLGTLMAFTHKTYHDFLPEFLVFPSEWIAFQNSTVFVFSGNVPRIFPICFPPVSKFLKFFVE